MTRRMAGLMLCALALGLLLALDGPQSGPLVEPSAGADRPQRPEPDSPASAASLADAALRGPAALGTAQAEHVAQVAEVAQLAQLAQVTHAAQAAHVAQVAPAAQVAQVAQAAQLDDAVVDLFAGAGAPAPSAAPPRTAADGEPPAAVPVTLLGFKEENGVRDAYLLHDGAVHMVRAGATLQRRYRVLALLQDAVHLQDQQTGERIRIAFGDIE